MGSAHASTPETQLRTGEHADRFYHAHRCATLYRILLASGVCGDIGYAVFNESIQPLWRVLSLVGRPIF
jgi:hypothetical protein